MMKTKKERAKCHSRFFSQVSTPCTLMEITFLVKSTETTLPALAEIGSRQTIPFWWDDVEDVVICEKIACTAFNKVGLSYTN